MNKRCSYSLIILLIPGFLFQAMNYNLNLDSFSHGQVRSKMWLKENFQKHISQDRFRHAVFLGSWYGVLPFLLLSSGALKADKLTMVELDEYSLNVSREVLEFWLVEGMPINFCAMDAFSLPYEADFLEDVDLIFNTACEHMPGRGWFDRIPAGTTLILQGTDMPHEEHIFPFADLNTFVETFRNQKILYQGQVHFSYPDKSFDRFMTIGQKL